MVRAGHHSKRVCWWVLERDDEIATLGAVRHRRARANVRLELIKTEINDLYLVSSPSEKS